MDVLKSFYKQEQAIQFSRINYGTFVFSFEVDSGGQRRYFVTTKEKFWSSYKLDRDKNCYEVITEGSKSKMYIDLEYLIDENPNKNGEVMTRRLIDSINKVLLDCFQVDNKFKDVLILESTSHQKFSVHLVFKQICFRDNLMIKEFLKFFESHLSDEDKELFAVSHRGKLSTFWDSKVYTKNRNFRLFLSTKYQKPTPLVVAPYDESVEASSPSPDVQFKVFEHSLVTNVGPDCKILDMAKVIGDPSFKASERSASKFDLRSTKQSPYPELDNFVKSCLKLGGFIRGWKMEEENRILFIIGGSRFCINVQREHRSNHIFYVCDLRSMTMNQYCHSCIGFRGPDITIPGTIFDWRDEFDSSF